jgi:hypothetical protein
MSKSRPHIDLNKQFVPSDAKDIKFLHYVCNMFHNLVGEWIPFERVAPEDAADFDKQLAELVYEALNSAMKERKGKRLTRHEFVTSQLVPKFKNIASQYRQMWLEHNEADTYPEVDSSMQVQEQSYADTILDHFSKGKITREQMLMHMRDA